MLETAAILGSRNAEIQFVVALAETRHKAEFDSLKSNIEKLRLKLPKTLIAIEKDTYNCLNASDAAAVASGTATLEAGILGTPMVVVYKASSLNYKLVRPLISVKHFGLINLIADDRIVAELIQDDFTSEKLADELFQLLDPQLNACTRENLRVAAAKLGSGGASKRAAMAILKIVV